MCNMSRSRMSSTHHILKINFHFSCIQACMHISDKDDDVKLILQTSCVYTRCVHDSLWMHACMSGMYMPNLDSVHFGVHANLARTAVAINSMNTCSYTKAFENRNYKYYF